MRAQQQQQQVTVSVCQQSTLNSQPVADSRCIRPAYALPSSQSPHISQSWLKCKADLFTLHMHSRDTDKPRAPLPMAIHVGQLHFESRAVASVSLLHSVYQTQT